MKLKSAYTKKKNLIYARKNRANQTWGEMILWKKLRNRQFLGYKFRRQVPIGKYIVDFYCERLTLIIEVDGMSHDERNYVYDNTREEDLKKLGVTVIRVTDKNVRTSIYDVLQEIENYILEKESPHPPRT